MKRLILLFVFFSLVLGKPANNRGLRQKYYNRMRPLDKIGQMYSKLTSVNNDLYFEELKNISAECKNEEYKNSLCVETIPSITESIKNLRNHILTTADTKVLLELLVSLHEGVFYTYRNSYNKNNFTLPKEEVRKIYDMVRSIKWTGNIMASETNLDILITKVTNIFLFTDYLKEGDYQLEVIDYFFLHLFKWKVDNLILYTYIVRAHFLILKRYVEVYKGENKVNFLYKILYNIERMQIISQKLYPDDFVQSYKLFLYIDFLNLENFTPDIMRGSRVSLDYDIITHDDILRKEDFFTIRDNVHCTIYHNQNGEEIIAALRKVENVFVSKMKIDADDLLKNVRKNVKIYIFDNNTDYRKYDRFFKYESDNGGITYNQGDSSSVYMYNTNMGIRNLEHEFVHVISHFYLSGDDGNDIPLFVVEGLAEAVGQKLCDTRIMSFDVPVEFSSVEYIFGAVSYNAKISPYTIGNIVMSYALKYGYHKEIKDAYKGDISTVKKMINDNKRVLQDFANGFVRDAKKCDTERISTDSISFSEKYKMDERDVIVCIDNTYFFLYEDHIQMLVGDRKNYILNSTFISQNINIMAPEYVSDMLYFIHYTLGGIFFEYGVTHATNINKPIDVYKNNKLVTKDNPLFHKLYKKLYEMLIEFVDDTMEKDYDTFVMVNTKRRDILEDLKKRDVVDLVTVNYNVKAPIHRFLYKINSAPLITREELNELSSLDTKQIVSGIRTVGDIIEDSFSISDIYNKNIEYIKRASGINYLSKNTIYPLRYELGFRNASSKFRLVPGQTFEGVPDLITEKKEVIKKPPAKLLTINFDVLNEIIKDNNAAVVKKETTKSKPKEKYNNDSIEKGIESISDSVREMRKKVDDIYTILMNNSRRRRQV